MFATLLEKTSSVRACMVRGEKIKTYYYYIYYNASGKNTRVSSRHQGHPHSASLSSTMAFDTYAAFLRILNNEEVCLIHPVRASTLLIFNLRYLPLWLPSSPSPSSYSIQMVCTLHRLSPSPHPSQAGTMFELVNALDEGAEDLKKQAANPISLNAGCELFTAFVTLFPHDSAVCPPAISSVYICSTIARPELCRSEEATYPPGSKLCGRSPHVSQENR